MNAYDAQQRKIYPPKNWLRRWFANLVDRERRIRQLEVINGMMSEARQADASEYHDMMYGARHARALEGMARDEMLAALRDLAFHARTSGGTAGRDDGLIRACDHATRIIEKYTPPEAGESIK